MKNKLTPAPLPINQFAFEKIRSKNMIYVDKTQQIYNMISNPDYYFLSRPRRFGKSLLVSILKHIYLGNRNYFKGLWIDQHTDWEWKEWPIIWFDFNSISNGNENELKQGLHDALEHNLDRYHIKLIKTGLKEKFKEALSQLHKATHSKIVILVDEYDKPIIDHLDDEEQIQIAKKNRRVMKEFYGILKDIEAGPLVELLFITGVSKFSQVSVFSELNTLTDLSMDENYATLLGYTQHELDTYFVDWIEKWRTEKQFSSQTIQQQLKNRYNGFRFSVAEDYVYNPISILNALKKQSFDNYWFDTATPTFLINLLLNSEITIPKIEQARLPKTHFNSFEPDDINIIAILFQTGYLTIKAVDWHNKFNVLYAFDFPNWEVKEAFLELLMMRFGNISHYDFRHKTIINDLSNQRFQLVVNTIQHVFNCIPPMDSHNADFFHYFYYMMIRSACPFSRVIDTDNKIHVLLEFDHQQFAINFSCTYSVQELLMQINASRGIVSPDSDVYKIAIHFDTNKRTIDDWNAETPEPTPVMIPEKQISTIQKTKIFIASSNDLSHERKEITLWASRKNKKLIAQNQYIDLVLWENLLQSFQGKRVQDYFNEEMLQCDIVIVLFYTQLGAFTREEFELTCRNLDQTNKPAHLFVFFKTTPPEKITKDYIKEYTKVLELREHIENSQQIYLLFDTVDSLILQLDRQIDLVMGK
jgi:hypothetical protein